MFVADAKAFAAGLHQVDSGSESVGRTCVVAVCLVLKHAELMDGGTMAGLFAWEDHLRRVDIRLVCIRLSCDSGRCLM